MKLHSGTPLLDERENIADKNAYELREGGGETRWQNSSTILKTLMIYIQKGRLVSNRGQIYLSFVLKNIISEFYIANKREKLLVNIVISLSSIHINQSL